MKFTYKVYNLIYNLRNKIGYRTLKTAVATPIALAIAQFFAINNVATAGILAMLCIQPSRKKSFRTAVDRFLACLLAIVFSALFFELLGYSPVILSLLLIIFIPTTLFLKIEKGIFTSTVITLNIYLFEHLNFEFIINQLYLIIIGIGVGFLVNLYMPSLDKKLEYIKKNVEVRFKIIFLQLAKIIRLEKNHWEQREIYELNKLLEQAMELVVRDKENRLISNKHSYYDYFEMRKHQFEILQEIIINIKRLPQQEKIGNDIALFIENLAMAVPTEDTTSQLLEELQQIKMKFRKYKLPKSYQEFEAQSILLQFLYNIERYLSVKHNLMQPQRFLKR